MLRAVVVAACLCVPSVSHATSDGFSTETLLGWSADGTTWAVHVFNPGGESIKIMRRGKLVVTVCNRLRTDGPPGQPRIDTSCKNGHKTIAVSFARRGNVDGLKRLDIRMHKRLRRFKLRPVQAAWRRAFNKKLVLRNGPYRRSPFNAHKCYQGWTLIRRADNKRIKRARMKGCLKALGGYVSDNGKYALVKYESTIQPSQDYGGLDHETAYAWIRL